MKRNGLRAWMVTALCAGLLAGCAARKSDLPYPDDPLLLSKKPLEAKVEDARPTVVALGEPTAPPVPEEAIVAAPGSPPPMYHAELGTVGVERRSKVPAKTVSAPKERVSAIPAVRSQPSLEPPPAPAQPDPAKVFGHGANYAWLQGVLDRHYRGHLDLRYCDPAVDDNWGGKVCLEPDARLAEFEDGDVLFLEGELIAPANGKGGWHQYPHYKVRAVRLVQHSH